MNDTVALANEYYETMRREDNSHTLSINILERRFKLKAGQLRHFRANRKRRKQKDVKLMHLGGERTDLKTGLSTLYEMFGDLL